MTVLALLLKEIVPPAPKNAPAIVAKFVKWMVYAAIRPDVEMEHAIHPQKIVSIVQVIAPVLRYKCAMAMVNADNRRFVGTANATHKVKTAKAARLIAPVLAAKSAKAMADATRQLHDAAMENAMRKVKIAPTARLIAPVVAVKSVRKVDAHPSAAMAYVSQVRPFLKRAALVQTIANARFAATMASVCVKSPSLCAR